AVLLARLADNALCVDAIAGDAPVGIFLLRVDIGETGLDRAQLIAADAAIKDLIAAGCGIEAPGAVLAHEWDREWPIFAAKDQHGLVRTLHHHLMLVVVSLDNAIARRRIGDPIAGGDDVGAIATQDTQDSLPVAGLGRAHKGTDGLVSSLERLLPVCGRYRHREHYRCQRSESRQRWNRLGKGENSDHGILRILISHSVVPRAFHIQAVSARSG